MLCITEHIFVKKEKKKMLKTVWPDCKANSTGHVFEKHGCPWRQQSQIMAKSLSPTF